MDWKLLVTSGDVESVHIRCYELQDGDNLPELIADFQEAYVVAIVLINTTDNYILQPSFLSGMQVCHIPVLVLTKSDGLKLLKNVEQCQEIVFAKITVESFVDLQQILQMRKNSPHTSPEQTYAGQWCWICVYVAYWPAFSSVYFSGYGQRLMQFLTRDKHPSFDLNGKLKKLTFTTSGDPLIVCEDPGTFIMVMSTLNQFEKHVSAITSYGRALNCKYYNPSIIHTLHTLYLQVLT